MNPLDNLCYIASETLYHVLGGKEAGWKPVHIRHEGSSHWYLQHEDGTIIDLTAGQFEELPDYSKGRGKGFLTKQPSKRSKAILAKIKRKSNET